MANEIGKTSRWKWIVRLILAIAIACLLIACKQEHIELAVDIIEILIGEETTGQQDEEIVETQPIIVEGEMQVHFIDVGNADATLFIQDGHMMLYDVATAGRGDDVAAYVKALGYDYIDVLVVTHPHDDHMGGMAKFLSEIDVGIIYGPDIFGIEELDDKDWFDKMMTAIDTIDAELNQGIDEEKQTSIWHFPRDSEGDFVEFMLGDALVEFFAPTKDEYSDFNDYSICAKITFGEIEIIMTGDATEAVEMEILERGIDVNAEILHASHHGSYTGNSKAFLEAISPEAVVISCGMGNRYRHPSEEAINRFEEMEIPVYRNDESGDIIITTDGISYTFNVEPGSYLSGDDYEAMEGK